MADNDVGLVGGGGGNVVIRGGSGEIPLLRFFRGVGQMGQGYRESGVPGALGALAQPDDYQERGAIARLQKEEAPRLKAIDDLLSSGQHAEAFNESMRVRTELGSVASQGAINAVLGGREKRAAAGLLDPQRIGGMAPEAQGPELTRLSAFLGGGEPGATREAGATLGALRGNEAAAAANRATADQTTQRTPAEVDLLKSQAEQNRAQSGYYNRSPGAGMGGGGGGSTIASEREGRLLRGQRAEMIRRLTKDLKEYPDLADSVGPTVNAINALGDKIGNVGQVILGGTPEAPAIVEVPRETPQAVGEGAAPGQPVPQVSPGAASATATAAPPTQTSNAARATAREVFGDLINSARATPKGGFYPSKADALEQLQAAGIVDKGQQEVVLAALLQEIDDAQAEGLKPTGEFGIGGMRAKIQTRREAPDERLPYSPPLR